MALLLPYYCLALAVAMLSTISEDVRISFRERQVNHRAWRKVEGRPTWTVFDVINVTVLVSFAGLRHYVGTDYELYVRIYERVGNQPLASDIAAAPQEAGFVTLMYFLKGISESPHLLFWAASAITVVPVYVTIKRQSLNPALALTLYILLAAYLAPLNTVRQGIAVALLFCLASRPRNIITYIVGAVLAASFHVSALIAAVVMLAVYRWRPRLRTAVLLWGGAAVAAATIGSVPFIRDGLLLLNPRYEAYLDDAGTGIGGYLQIVAYLGLILYVRVLSRGLGDNQQTVRQMTYLLVGIAFMIVGTQAVVLYRMADYFTIFGLLWAPNRLVETTKGRPERAAALALASSVYTGFYLMNYADLVPYRTYL